MFEELGPERGAPARQRLQPAPRQPLRLARGRDAGDADRRADRPPGRGRTSGTPRPSCGWSRRRRSPRPTRDGGMTGRRRAAGRSSASRGLHRRLRLIEGPQGPRVLLDGRPVLLLCSNNYLGLADHPRGARRGGRGGDALGRRRRRLAADLRQHGAAPARWRSGWPSSRATRRRCSSAPATSPTPARSRRWRGAARSSSPTSSTTPASSTAAAWRGPRPSSTATRDVEHLAWGLREAGGTRGADRHRRRLLDGRRPGAAARSWRGWPATTAAG